ncbi:MAG: transposase [Janthinobacterium lividum]
MNLKRRLFTKDFKLQVIRQVQAGKSIAQTARERGLFPLVAMATVGLVHLARLCLGQ